MCLTSSGQKDHLQVMSSGDTVLHPSTTTSSSTSSSTTAPNSEDNFKLLPPGSEANVSDGEIGKEKASNNSSSLDNAVNLTSSISDSDLQDQSLLLLPSNNSMLDSTDPVAAAVGGREVTSFEANAFDEMGEMIRRENARSAFEITSFRPATMEDLDKSSNTGRPMSSDSLNIPAIPEKGESGGSEESIVSSAASAKPNSQEEVVADSCKQQQQQQTTTTAAAAATTREAAGESRQVCRGRCL